MSNNYSSIE